MSASVEDFERAVVGGLQLSLQPQLDATAARYLTQDRQDGLADPDGTSWVTLAAPVASGWYPGGTHIPSVFPSVEVAVPDETRTNFSLGNYDADAAIRLVIQIWVRDARFPVLNRTLKRYAPSVLDTLRATMSMSITTARFAYRTNPEAPDQDMRIVGGALLFLDLLDAQIR